MRRHRHRQEEDLGMWDIAKAAGMAGLKAAVGVEEELRRHRHRE